MRRRNRRRAEKLAEILRQARQDQGLSQEDLADRAGVSQPWLSMVENKGLLLDAFDCARLLAALGLPQTLPLQIAEDPSIEDPPPEKPPPPRQSYEQDPNDRDRARRARR